MNKKKYIFFYSGLRSRTKSAL